MLVLTRSRKENCIAIVAGEEIIYIVTSKIAGQIRLKFKSSDDVHILRTEMGIGAMSERIGDDKAIAIKMFAYAERDLT